MTIEEHIVSWSKERPAWQREVMRRVAAGEVLSDSDYKGLLEDIIEVKEPSPSLFWLDQFPQVATEDLSVCLVKIEKLKHVNALESQEPLTFEQGLTIVYGDNGSGKSGYARLLKRITRARHREEVLTDVFRDSPLEKPIASLSVLIGESEESLTWPESSRPELQRILFYDADCGRAYIVSESDFPYRPSALFVMDGLIEACVAVRALIDTKLAENAASATQLPAVPEHSQTSGAGQYIKSLSWRSSVEVLDSLIAMYDATKDTIEDLKDQEAHLRNVDTMKIRQQLTRQSEKFSALRKHLERLNEALGNESLAKLQTQQVEVRNLEEAATLLARQFELEPVPGVGSSPWKLLWETAQKFSKLQAYPDQEFPFLGNDSRCVLCQQSLELSARDRFKRFDEFVCNDTQTRLKEAKRTYEQELEVVQGLTISPEIVTTNLKDVEDANAEIVFEVRELLSKYQCASEQLRDALSNQQEIPQFKIEHDSVIVRLTEASNTAKAAAEELGNPEGIQKQLAALVAKRAELELLEKVKKSRPLIVKEIERLKEREVLEAVKRDAATTGITKKIIELSEEGITEVVRDSFTRETERLRLGRVTIAHTRADKGSLLHQPKLVGARQQVTLPRVFSEGERTALGLAAFFTEAYLTSSNSALILDDPVTSLDHIRRSLVATRLAEFAVNRQVILFTHDVAFVADLKREANARGVSVAERTVTRSRADHRKPGACTTKHPWKAKDVPARLDDLRQELGRIRREATTWDEKQYDDAVAVWAGNLSETWERIFSQEIVGPVLAEGGLEVRPMMVKVLARFSDEDHREFDGSYGRTSQWAKRHDKSVAVNYVAPDLDKLDEELHLVDNWFKRVKGYKA